MNKNQSVKKYLLAFALGAGFMTALCIMLRITPFGNETFLYDDLRREFIEYYAYLKRVLSGEESIVYSRHKGIGGSMLGLFINYMSSPLNLIYSFFPYSSFPTVLTGLLIIRMGLAAANFNVLLSGLGIRRSVSFSLCYSMSMWVFVSLLNPLWLDAVIMFPILLHFAVRLLGEPGSFRLFLITSLLTAFQFYLNYYTAVMMMIFIAAMAIIRWLTGMITFKTGKTLALSLICGGLLISPVIIPVFLELRLSEKTMDGNLIRNLFGGFTINNPLAVLSKLFPFAIDGRQVMFGMPHLYAGTILLPLILLYFIGPGLPRKEKILSGSLLGILFLSFVFSPLDLIWQGMNKPLGYPFRYAYLFVAVMIICASRAYDLYYDGGEAVSFKTLSWSFLIPGLCELVIIALRGPLHIDWLPLKWGLVGEALLLILFALSCLRLYSKHRELPTAAIVLVCIITVAELIANQAKIVRASYVPGQTLSDFRDKSAFKTAALDEIYKAEDGEGFYRIEDTVSDPYDSLNDSLVYGYHGISHYSTGDHKSVRYFLKAMGFNYNGLYDEYTADNTDTADAILSVRYLIEEDGIRAKDTVFPSAVLTSAPIYDEMLEDDPFAFQQEIARAFAGDADLPEIFKEASLISSDITEAADKSSVSMNGVVSAAADGEMYFYLNGLENRAQDMSVLLGGELKSGYANMSAIKILDLGYHHEGDIIDLELRVNSMPETADFGSLMVFSEDLSVLKDYADCSGKNAIIIKETSPTMVTFDNIQKGYDDLLISLPYEAGFKAYTSDGRELKVSQAFGALTSIALPGDFEGTVILAYTVPGFKAGCILLAIGVEMLLFIKRLYRKGDNNALHNNTGR